MAVLNKMINHKAPETPQQNGSKYAWSVVPRHMRGGNCCKVTGHEFLFDTGNFVAVDVIDESKTLSPQISYTQDEIPLAGLLEANSDKTLHNILRTLFDNIQILPAGQA
jgi:hypothetical protein